MLGLFSMHILGGYCISYRAFQPLAGACCLGQETIKKCVVCVFVCEAHFDTNCWKNNLISFTEKSRFSCLIMQTNVYLVGKYLITLRLWASKVFSDITFFTVFFIYSFFIYAIIQSSRFRTKRKKPRENRTKNENFHFRLKGVDRV